MKIIPPESERKTGNVHQGFKAIDILVHQVYYCFSVPVLNIRDLFESIINFER